MKRWAVLEFTGYRYDYRDEVEAPTMWQAREAAADRLGGKYLTTVPGQPKRKFRVRLEQQ